MPKTPQLPLGDDISREADRHGVVLEPGVTDRLLRFLELLDRWNRRIRLVGSSDPATLVGVHLADAFALVRAMIERSAPAEVSGPLIDVGSGAGLPGFVVALVVPSLKVSLCEISEKRTSFLYEAARQLAAEVEVLHRPVAEVVRDGRQFTQAVSRATFEPLEWLEVGRSLCGPGGTVWSLWTVEQEGAFKGPPPDTLHRYSLRDGRNRVIAAWQQPK